MKILWITNILLPPVCKHINKSTSVGGGWLFSSAQMLLSLDQHINLAVASVYTGTEFKRIQIDSIIYYLIPLQGNNCNYHKELEPIWTNIYNDYNPQIVHIHGTEFAHGLSFLKACPSANVIVSMQGLISVIARYYLSGMSNKDMLFSLTPYSLLKGETLWQEQNSFFKRGHIERQILSRVKYVIGRTSWDYAHSWAINPKLHYFFCNETLRDSFYTSHWNYLKCEPYSIFVSQAGYPIKGFHQILKAIPFILRDYPQTKVYIAGDNIIKNDTWTAKLKSSHYANYLRYLIKKNNLENKIFFLGKLNEQQICKRYLQSNVFVSASAIENSPNSLGEAQLLGVPCVSSYVGGAIDMMEGAEHFLYRFEEVEQLARKIGEIFSKKEKIDCSLLSERAVKRFDKINNAKRLIEIYSQII